MSDLLSQDEINALLETYKATGVEAMDLSGTQEKEVRVYDFSRPDKFSKEHLRSLNVIHSKYGASFAVGLATMLRTGTQVHLLALDQLTYQEYCASVPNGTLFAEVNLDPLNSTTIFEFNPLLVSTCVDLLAGGNVATPTPGVEITDIDKAIMKPVAEFALRKYAESWSSCVALRPRIVAMTTESTTHQVLLPSEPVVVVGYEISVGESVSMMSICIPAAAIEAVLPALSLGRTLNARSRYADKAAEALKKTFDDVEVECRAVLGRTSLTLGEVLDLEVGDLIELPTKVNGHAELWVENIATYSGILGMSGRNLALKVAKTLVDPNAE